MALTHCENLPALLQEMTSKNNGVCSNASVVFIHLEQKVKWNHMNACVKLIIIVA